MIQYDGFRGAFIEEYLEVSRIGKSVLSKMTLLENSSLSSKEIRAKLRRLTTESNIVLLRDGGKYIHKNGNFASEKYVKKALDSIQSNFSGFNKIYDRVLAHARKIK